MMGAAKRTTEWATERATEAAAIAAARPGAAPAEVEHLRAEVERLRAELAEAERRVAYFAALAAEDPLTGCLNRRGLLAELTRAISYVSRYGAGAALLLADLDRFKPVNDRHGHEAGDRLLAQVGAVLRGGVRASDTVGRIGGDEFAVLLWQADEAAAACKARALAEALRARPLRLDAALIPVSASFGTAVIRPGDGAEAVLARADQAMYAAKHAGQRGLAGPRAAAPQAMMSGVS